jgi:lysozyme
MNINSKGIALIKSFEGLSLSSYLCPAGHWTVGYGHTGSDVVPGLKMTMAQAEELLSGDLALVEKQVSHLVHVTLNSNQFSALVSFAFNVGYKKFSNSTLLKLINDKKDPSFEFLKWVRTKGIVLPGLKMRREAEKTLFNATSTPASKFLRMLRLQQLQCSLDFSGLCFS